MARPMLLKAAHDDTEQASLHLQWRETSHESVLTNLSHAVFRVLTYCGSLDESESLPALLHPYDAVGT
jgi:hypothetical protein